MALFFYSGRYLTLMDRRHEVKSEIKPCNCVSYKEFTFRQAKYEMYVDSLLIANKHNRQRLKDSVVKYGDLIMF